MKTPRQPEVNIGLVGHVDHGKTTLTQALTGEWTDRHSEEVKRGISIKLGYADAVFYKCPTCPSPQRYSIQDKCPHCGAQNEYLRSVSLVDAPGHETLMATMLSGAAIMNGAILLIAANEKCPQPQTREHLIALQIIGVKNVVVVQNKIDLMDKAGAQQNYREIQAFLKDSGFEDVPIVPLSANHGVNVDALIEALEARIPTPPHEDNKPPFMYVARSFDINRPGTPPSKLVGGVMGGSLLSGKFKVGDEIEIRPGPAGPEGGDGSGITTKIVSLVSGGRNLEELHPGGLAAIATTLDPSLTKSDGLTGRLVGLPGELPQLSTRLLLKPTLLERVVGSNKDIRVEKIHTGEILTLTIGTMIVAGKVTSARTEEVEIRLTRPAPVLPSARVAISRRLSAWRLIGFGIVAGGARPSPRQTAPPI
jgi:translation initiation factor 2 subunit 3